MSQLSPEVRELLGARNITHLAILMPDGEPQVSPVWIALEGDRLAIFSAQQLMPAGAIDKPLEDENPAYGTMCGPVWVKHPSLVEHFAVLC
ncbi:MAG: pyridoxamine 5'-phosphate oxidase family protein, partial [Egibacteraceae bacterium]